MIQVICPTCRATHALPESAAGQQMVCQFCQGVFGVPAAPATPTPVAPLPPHLAGGQLPAPKVAVETDDQEARHKPKPRVTSGGWAQLFFFGMIAVVLIGGLLGVVVVVKRGDLFSGGKSNPPPLANEQIIELGPAGSEPSRWSDASQVSLRRNRIKVRIDRVEFGAVSAKDGSNAVIISDKANFLHIYFNIKNHDPQSHVYHSWYGNSFRDELGNVLRAKLRDDANRNYEVRTFPEATRIRGHVPESELAAREEVNDVLIFEIGEPIDRGSIEYFRLELPAEAYGGKGYYRFQIPRGMITDF